MKSIGGYFELELQSKKAFHKEAVALNTGRNALEYILLAKGFTKLYLPHFTCHVVLQPLERLGLPYELYSIDENLEPLFDYAQVQPGEAFLYTNYFGLKEDFLSVLCRQLPNVIIDNSQAFYSTPVTGCTAFYSARKFFGVPDGAYAYTDKHLEQNLLQDSSYERFGHLLLRADQDAETGYAAFVANDKALDNNPIRRMSKITEKIMAGIPYAEYATIRRQNYQHLQDSLHSLNEVYFPLNTHTVPMVYPLLVSDGKKLRDKLVANRIYVAQYWPEVLANNLPHTIEHQYTSNLIHLPIDQRYNLEDMKRILKVISVHQ